MPFADFLTEVGQAGGGRGPAMLGALGQALGGKTAGQRRVDMFVNDELPRLAQEIERAGTRQDIEKSARGLLTSGLQAGLQPAALDKLMDMVVQPALRNVQGQELEGIRRDYGPQTTPITPQVAAEGQGQPLAPGTTFQPQTKPARPLDIEGAARYFEATGAKPTSFQEIFGTPALIQEREAQGRQHAAGAAQKEYETSQAKRLENIPLPGSAGEAGMTAGMLATPHGGAVGSYMTGLNPQREPSGAALDLKRQGLEIQQQRLQVLADRVQQGAATAAERQELARLKFELDKQEFELKKLGSVTQTEAPIEGGQFQIDQGVIAKTAVDRKMTTPEGIKKIAAELGYEITGTPSIELPKEETQFFGLQTRTNPQTGQPVRTPAKLTGDITLTRKPRTVTRQPGAAPGQAPPAAQPAGGQPPTVLMRAPDGSQRPVPADRVEEFKRRGATIVGR